ncbi:GH92 family glycosyl hydrolase [Fulvivirgaceae bacterium BMA10]|uniref:GH92 family glycosyl hydrolase n=1 Tax=Splendidivirga corallicola TaxID=3051826 RepID=A0ABT8KXY1_9BACT|nr:GH92 family glycosyl hydrolase [Fulvivirgaceae bacterium BMA10]
MKRSLYVIMLLWIIWFSISCDNQMRKQDPEMQKPQPVDLVYPLLDAANSRWFFFNSASRPFGMVNLSPDTQKEGTWGSGYRYDTDTVQGFSHIHAWQLSGVEVMPVAFEDGESASIFKDHSSKFDHAKEEIQPGYHMLMLERYGIKTELTSTIRVGFHRYTFVDKKEAGVLFNLEGQLGPSKIIKGDLKQFGTREIQGSLVNAPTRRRPKEFQIYFHVQFNQDIDRLLKPSDQQLNKVIVTFKDISDEPLLMKVGLSYISSDQAAKNLDAELAHWNFDQIVAESHSQWNDMLSRIKIEGGDEKEQRRFYTDLWHALQGRRIISDADGHYPDYTGKERQIKRIPLDDHGKPKFNHYNSDAFWGAQWTLNTLWHLVYPEISEEFVNSLLLYYKDGGLIPRGPSGGNYTNVMTGASSTPFIVSAYQKGIREYDVDLAYEGIKKNHMPGGMMGRSGYEHLSAMGGGLEHYIKKGYVPYPLPEGDFGYHQDGASLTLEYAYQDWTLAQLAKALGKEEDYTYFLKRSENYKNQYNPESGWMRPKDIDGRWKVPFDPFQYEHGFNESNGAQSSWFVPHDQPGLALLMGGKAIAAERLNSLFEKASELNFTAGTSHDRELHPEFTRIPVNYGNQPSIQTAFIFNHLDHPYLTQLWSRQVAEKAFGGLSPHTGYNGDEDQGLMGSLAVLFKIGLFQMNGGTEEDPVYEIGSPLFDKVTLHLNPDYYPGERFTILARNNDSHKPYIQSASLNGKTLSTYYFRHSEIINGGELLLDMGEEPNQHWGLLGGKD